MLNKAVVLLWKPTLLATDTPLSNEQLDDRIQNCGGYVQCSGGHSDVVSAMKSYVFKLLSFLYREGVHTAAL